MRSPLAKTPAIGTPAWVACGRCGQKWTGIAAAHCSAETSIALPLLPVGDCDPRFGPEGNAHLHQSAVHGGRVSVELFADLVSAHTSSAIKSRSLCPPADGTVFELVVPGTHRTEVRWSIVSAVAVDVVNLVSIGDPSIENSVLVGFDVLVGADSPSQPDISMRGAISTRFILRNCFTRKELPNLATVSQLSARRTEATLRRTGNRAPTRPTVDRGHGLTLQVTTLCHRTFASVRAFDIHRSGGECRDPATIIDKHGNPRLVPIERQHWSGWASPSSDDGTEWWDR
jgi:hypothetical protein